MDEPTISLSSTLEPALTKFADACFACGECVGASAAQNLPTLATAADEARKQLLLEIKKYMADALAHGLGYDPVKGHTQANGLKRMKTMSEVKRAHLQYALATTDTMDEAARALEIDIATVYRMRVRWKLPIHDQHGGRWHDGKPEA